MSRGAKIAYLQHLEEQAEIKAREAYWVKIFANIPDESINKDKVDP